MKRDDANTNSSARGLSPAGMAGTAVVGGLIGAAMAMFLSDEKRRQRISDIFLEFRKTTENLGADLQERGEAVGAELSNRARDAKDRVRDMASTALDDAQDAAEQASDEAKKTARKVKDDVDEKVANAKK